MSMKLENISNSVKAAVAIGILAIGGFTYHGQFITEAEASESARIGWIRDLEAEIRMLERQPQTPQLKQEIADLKKKLNCIRTADDNKVKFC
jgi:hypothetical protein